MRKTIPVLFGLLVASSQCLAAAKVEGTCFNLPPNPVPITGTSPVTGLQEKVTFTVQLARDVEPFDRSGISLTIRNAVFDPKTGKYSFEVDLPDPKKPVAVFIDYARDGFSTATLERIVLVDGVTNHIDLVVPRENQMHRPVAPCLQEPCCPEVRRYFSLFHRK